MEFVNDYAERRGIRLTQRCALLHLLTDTEEGKQPGTGYTAEGCEGTSEAHRDRDSSRPGQSPFNPAEAMGLDYFRTVRLGAVQFQLRCPCPVPSTDQGSLSG